MHHAPVLIDISPDRRVRKATRIHNRSLEHNDCFDRIVRSQCSKIEENAVYLYG